MGGDSVEGVECRCSFIIPSLCQNDKQKKLRFSKQFMLLSCLRLLLLPFLTVKVYILVAAPYQ